MAARTVCMLLAGLSPALSLKGATCGGVHCFGRSVYCCTSSAGLQTCCYTSLDEEIWFWIVLVIGVLLIAAVLFCACRTIYRYHNAGQYTKLRLQRPDNYGSISCTVANINIPPPPFETSSEEDDCGQLPTYDAVMSMPPAYNETDDRGTRGSINYVYHDCGIHSVI